MRYLIAVAILACLPLCSHADGYANIDACQNVAKTARYIALATQAGRADAQIQLALLENHFPELSDDLRKKAESDAKLMTSEKIERENFDSCLARLKASRAAGGSGEMP
jgi:hypothetical protein